MRVLFQGPLCVGTTTLHRFQALAATGDVEVIPLDSQLRAPSRTQSKTSPMALYRRARWKLRWPIDTFHENEELLAAAAQHRPDAVIVENSQTIQLGTLRKLRELGVETLVYYTPDDIIARHNQSWPLQFTFHEWDIFFTTKTFNVPELRARGVRRPTLIGNAFDPDTHRALTPAEAGADFERWDIVFVGTYERERCVSLNRLSRQGMTVVIYGNDWRRSRVDPRIELRGQAIDQEYTRAMHSGKIAMGFLRKINRDRITTRSIEITAMARPMLAEKTDEHDAHFVDGAEYVGFSNDDEMVAKASLLLGDSALRARIGLAGMNWCWASGYSTADRAKQMIAELTSVVDRRASNASSRNEDA